MSKHALEDIATVNDAEDLLSRAKSAAVMAAVTGSVGSTDGWSSRKLDGTLETKPDITAEAIDQITSPINRKYGVKSWGPAYRVLRNGLDTDIVIVLPGRAGRYVSHAA